MKPDDVIEEIKKLGIKKISRRTLLLWEKKQLIPAAIRGSGGRGIGAFADYPDCTAAEFSASWSVMYDDHLKYDQVALIRAEALSNPISDKSKKWLKLRKDFLELRKIFLGIEEEKTELNKSFVSTLALRNEHLNIIKEYMNLLPDGSTEKLHKEIEYLHIQIEILKLENERLKMELEDKE